MCKPASFVLTRDSVFFSTTSNSHEQIIEEHNLHADGAHGPNVLRVEIYPLDGNYDSDHRQWKYKIDQDILPSWHDSNRDEYRIRQAMNSWKEYHCCTQDQGNNQLGGFKVNQNVRGRATQTAGNDSTQTAGNDSTQTAGNYATQTAGNYATQAAGNDSTQTAGNKSTQTAKYKSTQKAGYGSTQTAGAGSTQTAGVESTQTAGDDSTQTAGAGSTQTAGYGSTQTAWNDSTQTAGNKSTQTAGNYATQAAGVGSVQITRWFDNDSGDWKTATRTITHDLANKPYYVSNGVWTLVENEEK